MEECAIFSISPPHACFVQKGLTTREGRSPLLNDPFDILGMNVLGPSPTQQIFQRPTHVVEPTLIEEVEVSVRQTGVNQGGGGVDQEPKIWKRSRLFIGKRSCLSPVRDFGCWHVTLTGGMLTQVAPILIDDVAGHSGDSKSQTKDSVQNAPAAAGYDLHLPACGNEPRPAVVRSPAREP